MTRLHHRIRTVAARSDTVCMFQIPPYIIGMPLYDPAQCCGYVIQRLKNEGFHVQYGHPNVLFIRWDIRDRPAAQNQQNDGASSARRLSPAVPTASSGAAAVPSQQHVPTIYESTGQLFS